MLNKMNRNLLLTVVMSVWVLAGCGKQNAAHEAYRLPSDWYALPENNVQTNVSSFSADENAQETETSPEQVENTLGPSVDQLFNANQQAIEDVPMPAPETVATAPSVDLTKKHPADWMPWHAEYIWADLSISMTGILGVLTVKGTPTVTTLWRRQYPAATSTRPERLLINENTDPGTIQVSESSSAADLERQVAPVVEAAAATGHIQNKAALKQNLLETTRSFQSVIQSLATAEPGSQWWVSRFRMDFTADASGSISPIISLGGDVRFRIEWHRMMRKPVSVPVVRNVPDQYKKLRTSLVNFVESTSQDLESLAFEPVERHGFKAYSFRVGLGFTAGGDLGIAKLSTSAIGQIYFTRDVPKPVVNPKPPKIQLSETLNLIEDRPVASHLNYAQLMGVGFHSSDDGDSQGGSRLERMVFKVDRKKFRKGLKKASKMGEFFAKRAAKAHFGKWRIFELRTSFDMSISGDTKLATVGGASTAEINFFNQDF